MHKNVFFVVFFLKIRTVAESLATGLYMKDMVFLALLLTMPFFAAGQLLTEENFERKNKVLMEEFYLKADTLKSLISMKKDTEKKDSLIAVYNNLADEHVTQYFGLVLKYAATSNGLERIFRHV